MNELHVLDWRRQMMGLYRDVRACDRPADAYDQWVQRRVELFATHPASANRAASLRHASYSPELRFAVPIEAVDDPAELAIPTGTDGVVPFTRLGRVTLDGVGQLDVWWLDSYGGGVWLPIRDPSSETYGGGRYILDTIKGADLGSEAGRLVVDLNFAYNPSCAYDEAWACPLAPPGNVVASPLTCGELTPTGE